MATIACPLPSQGFDLTECAVPWRILTDAGHTVRFFTPAGGPAACDPSVRTPVVFGMLGAKPDNVVLYDQMSETAGYRSAQPWSELSVDGFDALLLPGGHAPGVREYLESPHLQGVVVQAFARDLPVAAICHGPVLLARSRQADGQSVLAGRHVTALPGWMEWSAYALTFWKLGRHYRTYPQTVEAEVRAAVESGGSFERGPLTNRYDAPFIVEDGSLVTGRWPGDSAALAQALIQRLPA